MRGLGAEGCPTAPPSHPKAPTVLPCSLTGGPWPTRAGWPQWAGRQTWAPRACWAAGECGARWGKCLSLGAMWDGGMMGWEELSPWTPSAPGWGCSQGGAFGRMGMSLSSPPPCLQGDPGKPGDPGRDVSTSGEGSFRFCSCWGHQTCKGLMSCPMFLGPGQCTVPSRVPLPVTLPAPRAGCGRWVPCCLALPTSPFPTGAARAAWGAGSTWPRGSPGTTRHPCKYQLPWGHILSHALCGSQLDPSGRACPVPSSPLRLQWGPGTPGCWCPWLVENLEGSLTAFFSSQGKPGEDGKPGLNGKNVSRGSRA